MPHINDHIETFLDYYCNLEHSPEYAVLLNGAWGSGKTWFIKKYCEKLASEEKKYLYVSLYGMSTFAEIEDAFFQQMHPILSSKGMEIGSKILKGVLKTTLKIDLNCDGKEEATVTSQIPDIKIPEYFKNTSDSIIIFDDLERCSINIENILGYINHFVEHQGLKVIIVANEEQLCKGDDKEGGEKYRDIKEKLIGKTLKMLPDVDAVLADFIPTVTDPNARDFLLRNLETVKDVYSISGYENLRVLKQTLWDFERIYVTLPEEARSKEDLMRRLLELLLALSLEVRLGKIKASDIANLDREYAVRLARPQNSDKSAISEVFDKYSSINIIDRLLTNTCWTDILDRGFIDKEVIMESLLKSVFFYQESTPNWIKLWHFTDLSDSEFEILLSKVEKEYVNKQFDDVGVIKHVAGLFFLLIEIGLYSKDAAFILQTGKENIDSLKKSKELIKNKDLDSDGYQGLSYYGRETESFKLLQEYIIKQINEAIIENMPNVVSDLLSAMSSDSRKFYRMLTLNDSSESIYYDTPILKHIPSGEFIDTFLKADPDSRRYTAYVLKKRYEHNEINRRLLGEHEWLKQLYNSFKEEQKKYQGKLTGHILDSIIVRIEKSIQRLESAKETAVTLDSPVIINIGDA